MSISDHLPTFFVKKKEKLKGSFSEFQDRSYARYDKTTFQNEIKSHYMFSGKMMVILKCYGI